MYPPGIFRSGDMSKPPTRFESADVRDVMRIQEDIDRDEACVKRRSTANEKRVTQRYSCENRGDWHAVAHIDRRIEEIRGQKYLEREQYLARKRANEVARERRNRDSSSDAESLLVFTLLCRIVLCRGLLLLHTYNCGCILIFVKHLYLYEKRRVCT